MIDGGLVSYGPYGGGGVPDQWGSQGPDPGQEPPARHEHQSPPGRGGRSQAAMSLRTSYVVDDTVVRVSGQGMAAYSLADGTEQWAKQAPSGQEVCTASPEIVTSAGKPVAGVVYSSPDLGQDGGCGRVAAVDSTSGEELWAFESNDDVVVPGSAAVAASDGTIYATALNPGSVLAIDVETGEVAWTQPVPPDDCATGDIAVGDGVVLAVAPCLVGDSGQHLVALDADTGDVSWTEEFELRSAIRVARIVSATPPVLHLPHDTGRGGELRVLGDGGSPQDVVPAPDQGLELQLHPVAPQGSDDATFPVAIVDGMLIAVSALDARRPQDVVAFDLTTGERVWTRELPDGLHTMARSTDPAQVVLVGYQGSDRARMFTVDPRDGSVTPGDTLGSPPQGHQVAAVRYLVAGETLLRLREGDSELTSGPAVVAFRAS